MQAMSRLINKRKGAIMAGGNANKGWQIAGVVVTILLGAGTVLLTGGELKGKIKANESQISRVDAAAKAHQAKTEERIEKLREDSDCRFDRIMETIHKVQLQQASMLANQGTLQRDMKQIMVKLDRMRTESERGD
jgi:ABC-type phosphate transport system auxiliary subunit